MDAFDMWTQGLKDEMQYIIGIDPGNNGAIAVFDITGNFITVHDTPTEKTKATKTKKSRMKISGSGLHELFLNYKITKAFIEDVHSTPQMGVTSSYNFGEGVGLIKGVLSSHEITIKEISPQKWKARFNLIRKDKKASIAEAQIQVPESAKFLTRFKDDGRAEAILIGLYGVR